MSGNIEIWEIEIYSTQNKTKLYNKREEEES